MMTSVHEITPQEKAILQSASEAAAMPLSAAIGLFLKECHKGGFHPKVAGAGLSVFVLASLAKTVAMCSGMNPNEIKDKDLERIAMELQKQLAKTVNALIVKYNNAETGEMN